MEKYLGVKVINAEPMTAKDFSNLTGKLQPGEDGYKVVYEDGYTSWSPKDVFEKAYRKVGDYSSIMIDANTVTGEWNWGGSDCQSC